MSSSARESFARGSIMMLDHLNSQQPSGVTSVELAVCLCNMFVSM